MGSDDDAHVPILLYGPPFEKGRYPAFVRVVDIAPTLAAILGLTPTEPLDGRVLTDALAEEHRQDNRPPQRRR
jgi:arylsulfatase A-like enzyme